MLSAMAANAQGIPARADVFGDQILQHILSFVPRSSELALWYSFQPETGHYLVKAGWPVVLKKMCHWKEADTICICCGANQEPGDPNESDDSLHISASLCWLGKGHDRDNTALFIIII